jgi:hypothetical protein
MGSVKNTQERDESRDADNPFLSSETSVILNIPSMKKSGGFFTQFVLFLTLPKRMLHGIV